jgi:uncharacterized protein with NAD-binding domain and iron-sulfur cluster
MKSVAVLGGGVGGLSAAHELAERRFKVTVYEMRDAFGGKARSMDVPDTGTGGRKDLPAEHGFRFFPSFYKHVVDTMGRIPYKQGTVADNLVPTTMMLLAQGGRKNDLPAPTVPPSSVNDVVASLKFMREFVFGLGIPTHEFLDYTNGLLTLLVSCDKRRYSDWEEMSWWDFMDAGHKTKAFNKFLGDGITRCLVAARGREMSARTGGMISLRLMLNSGAPADRVLNGPTSEVWIDPWREYLGGLGVELRGGYRVDGIHCNGREITGVTVAGPHGDERITADYYVAALPKEKLAPLISPQMRAADRRLGALNRLETRWMNGAMFYLDRDVPLEPGHTIFVDSEWSLTAISQAQFWEGVVDLEQRGDGRVEGILSVDISEWRTPGTVTGKEARLCTKEEIRDEVQKQINDHIDNDRLDDANILEFFLDPAISFPNPPEAAKNAEPLLINTPRSWADRPEAWTSIPNFFIAADFVRTDTDLATMEAANEAARVAVNAILKSTGSKEQPCHLWKFPEPRILAPFRLLDRLLWRLGRKPPKPPVQMTPTGEVEPTGPVGRTVLAVTRRLR